MAAPARTIQLRLLRQRYAVRAFAQAQPGRRRRPATRAAHARAIVQRAGRGPDRVGCSAGTDCAGTHTGRERAADRRALGATGGRRSHRVETRHRESATAGKLAGRSLTLCTRWTKHGCSCTCCAGDSPGIVVTRVTCRPRNCRPGSCRLGRLSIQSLTAPAVFLAVLPAMPAARSCSGRCASASNRPGLRPA